MKTTPEQFKARLESGQTPFTEACADLSGDAQELKAKLEALLAEVRGGAQ